MYWLDFIITDCRLHTVNMGAITHHKKAERTIRARVWRPVEKAEKSPIGKVNTKKEMVSIGVNTDPVIVTQSVLSLEEEEPQPGPSKAPDVVVISSESEEDEDLPSSQPVIPDNDLAYFLAQSTLELSLSEEEPEPEPICIVTVHNWVNWDSDTDLYMNQDLGLRAYVNRKSSRLKSRNSFLARFQPDEFGIITIPLGITLGWHQQGYCVEASNRGIPDVKDYKLIPKLFHYGDNIDQECVVQIRTTAEDPSWLRDFPVCRLRVVPADHQLPDVDSSDDDTINYY